MQILKQTFHKVLDCNVYPGRSVLLITYFKKILLSHFVRFIDLFPSFWHVTSLYILIGEYLIVMK